jgi:hypothetical protein
LGILRLLKAGQDGVSALTAVRAWAGVSDNAAIMKVAAYVIEQADLARTVIANSALAEEAKVGVLTTIDGVSNAFSLGEVNTSWKNHIRDVSAAIANLVILLSALGINTNPETPAEAIDLIKEIETMMASFDDTTLDPAVRDIGKRHMAVLATLLRHIPIFGLEAALTTYFELVMKLRRADIGTTEASHTKLQSLFAGMKNWGDRLGSLDRLWNSGAKLIEHAESSGLLTYLPEI